MSNVFGLTFFIIHKQHLIELLEDAHRKGFLDGLDHNNYEDPREIGFDAAVSKYASEIANRLEEEQDEDGDDNNFGL